MIVGQPLLLLLILLLFRFCSYGWNEMRIEVSESDHSVEVGNGHLGDITEIRPTRRGEHFKAPC